MISYDNFKDVFVEEVKKELADAGIDANVSLHTVNKLNEMDISGFGHITDRDPYNPYFCYLKGNKY